MSTETSPAERHKLWSLVAWVSYCVGIVAVAIVSEFVPFAGSWAVFALGGNAALRIAVVGIPIAVSVFSWAVSVFVGESRLRYTPFLWWLLALAGLASLSTVFALDPMTALFGWEKQEQGFLLWMVYLLIAALGSQMVTSPRRVGQLSRVIIGGATYVAAIGISEVLGARPTDMVATEGLWMLARGMSTMMNPDFLGNYLVIPAVLGVALAAGCQGRDRILAIAGTAIIALGLVLTLVRGAWAGLFVGLLALSVLVVVVGSLANRKDSSAAVESSPFDGAGYCPSGKQAPKLDTRPIALVWMMLAVVLVVAAIASPSISNIAERFIDPIEDSGRLPLWSESFSAAGDRWLLGAGPDNFLYAWQLHAGEATVRSNGVALILDSSHNFYIDTAVQFGYPFTLLAVVGVIWLCVRAVRAVIPVVAQGTTRGWEVLGVVAAMCAIGASFAVGITIVPILVTFFALLGMLMGIDARPVAAPVAGGVRVGVLAGAATVALLCALWASLSGLSAIVGNQATTSYALRAERNLAALSVAPWRISPVFDLINSTTNMMPAQQQALGVTTQAAYERMLKREPLKALHHYHYGDWLLLANGDAQGALEYAERALRLQPTSAPALMLRGDALVALGQWDQGLADLAESVRMESLAQTRHSWDGPWVAYLNALVADGRDRGNAESLAVARSTLEAFRVRFPQSNAVEQFEQMLSGGGGAGAEDAE